MYRKFNRKPEPHNMTAKYAGNCHCCGAAIKAGEWVTYYPPGPAGPKGVIAHVGGLEGNGQRCFVNLRNAQEAKEAAYPYTPDCYPDPGELAEDRWNDTHR